MIDSKRTVAVNEHRNDAAHGGVGHGHGWELSVRARGARAMPCVDEVVKPGLHWLTVASGGLLALGGIGSCVSLDPFDIFDGVFNFLFGPPSIAVRGVEPSVDTWRHARAHGVLSLHTPGFLALASVSFRLLSEALPSTAHHQA